MKVKIACLVLLLGLSATFPSPGLADGVDAKIVLGGTGSVRCSESFECSFTGTTFTAFVNIGLSGTATVDVDNTTGGTISSLIVIVNNSFAGEGSPTLGLTCPSNEFFSTGTLIAPNECLFSGGTGIPNGVTFGETFAGFFDLGGVDPVPACPAQNPSNPNLCFTDTVTPEPASIFLLGTGLLALGGAARRRLKPVR